MKIKPILLAITMISLFAVTIVSIGNDNNNNAMMTAYAQGGPSACPDPGQCTCNAASGVMTDHAMSPPFNRINNGCTEPGTF